MDDEIEHEQPKNGYGKLQGIVNVAQVPKRSPFRYPGGKTWAVPIVRRWFASMPARPTMLCEPFAGGGIISLTVAFERLADHVTMVELDDHVAAVWKTIIDGDAKWLARRIIEYDLTHENVVATLAAEPQTTQEHAFQTILRNRVQRGGIMAPGAGLIKHGENGKGLKSRWYARTLRNRIMDIAHVRDRITFVHGDGLAVMRAHADDPRWAYFIDPPYTAGSAGKRAGKRLYIHNQLDHEELFRVAAVCAGPVLMTYDDDAEVRDLARRHGFDTHLVPMKSTHHAEMTELLIGRNLARARELS
jgi:DNA adenine methylase